MFSGMMDPGYRVHVMSVWPHQKPQKTVNETNANKNKIKLNEIDIK